MVFMKSIKKVTFILLINIVNLHLSSCYSEKLHEECLMNQKCKCSLNSFTYISNKMDCTYKSSQLTIEVFSEGISLTCKNLFSLDIMELVPNLSIDRFAYVLFDNCTLPENLPIAAILHKLSVTNCTKLSFLNKLNSNLTKHNFIDLYDLKELYLAIVTESVPEDLFSEKSLANLTTLNLGLYLNILPQNLFANLKNLQTLHIGSIDFTSIMNKLNPLVLTRNLFKPVKHLKVLSLQYNAFDQLEPDLLEFLINLEEIYLSFNKFKSLPEGFLKTNIHLKIFNLTGNYKPMDSVPSHFFANLPNLDNVILEGGLKLIPADIFVNSTNIRYISLAYNLLKTIPKEIFANLHSLLTLNLSFNDFYFLPESLFKDNNKLKAIKLSGNKLIEITSEHFIHLKSLEYLDLTNNLLTFEDLEFNKSFKDLSNIKEIYLQNNDIEQVPINMPSRLNVLNLSYNSITRFNYKEIINISLNDIEINLSNNRIRSINVNNLSDYAHHILKHQTIDLNNNPIQCDCNLKEFIKILASEEESIIKKKITFKVDNLNCKKHRYFYNIKKLSPSNLHCETVPKPCPIECNCLAIDDQELKVNCSNAHLTSVPDLAIIPINNFINITMFVLLLENNYIKELPLSETRGYANVTHLFLKNNYLKNINSSQLPKNLTTLDVTHNQLTTFNLETLKFLNETKLLNFIYLSNNPWTCDCIATYIMQLLDGKSLLLTKGAAIIRDFSDLFCAEPKSLKGKNFEQLDRMKLLCQLNTSQCPMKCNCWLRSFDQILLVNCSNAQLTAVPNLPNINSLNLTGIELNLTNNHIQELPLSQTRGYANVTKLFLANNNLKNIDKSQLPKNLTELDLKRNQLKSLNIETLRYINESRVFRYITLVENPWICDCNVKLLLRLMPNNLMLLKYLKLTCTGTLECELQTAECPKNCKCSNINNDSNLIINCSNAQLLTVPDLKPITRIMNSFNLNKIDLNLENNLLKDLPSSNITGYENVTKLFLGGNNFENIESFQLPANLKDLDLKRNKLTTLNNDTLKFLNTSKSLQHVYLSENPWKCDCADLSLLNFIQRTQLVMDFDLMTCADPSQIKYFYKLQELCFDQKNFYITLAMSLFAIGLFLALITALYYKYQEELKIWLYAHNMCLWFVTEEELDRNKTYDAFVSYSHKDEDFIYDYLIPELEDGSPAFKLCIDERDWLIGDCIPDRIHDSIANSRRTIVVLSKNFIESVWAKMEFKAAHKSALNEGRSRIIIIIYDDIEDIENLDDELKLYLKMNIYLKWGHPRFWNRLRYAMPHISRNRECDIALN